MAHPAGGQSPFGSINVTPIKVPFRRAASHGHLQRISSSSNSRPRSRRFGRPVRSNLLRQSSQVGSASRACRMASHVFATAGLIPGRWLRAAVSAARDVVSPCASGVTARERVWRRWCATNGALGSRTTTVFRACLITAHQSALHEHDAERGRWRPAPAPLGTVPRIECHGRLAIRGTVASGQHPTTARDVRDRPARRAPRVQPGVGQRGRPKRR